MSEADAPSIPITTVAAIGDIGPYHADINGSTSSGGIRGPFTISPISPNSAPTYPVLWAHDAERERKMVFEADNEGVPRSGADAKEQAVVAHKVASVWASASHCHFNRDFRFNSQSTSMQFTPRRTIGGRAWLSISLASEVEEKALVLWANTSFGLLMHWWHANKQQSGRGSIGKSALQSLSILDVHALKPQQREAATTLFDEFSTKDLLPLNEIDQDDTRREFDTKFARDVLGLPPHIFAEDGPLELLRMKLAREPSIRGHK